MENFRKTVDSLYPDNYVEFIDNPHFQTIDNIIYKSFRQYEKRKKDFQDLILISDKITLEELTA